MRILGHRGLAERGLVDALLAQALVLFEDGQCPGCGHPLKETTDPDNFGRYAPLLPTRCHACTALEMGMARYRDTDQPGALSFAVRLRQKLTRKG